MSDTPWLTVEEAAEYLRCSERYLREILANKRIPHVMFAGKALFHPGSLDGWLLREELKPDVDGGLQQENSKGGKPMIEADMERMLRDHPEEFFTEPLKLVSQQEAFGSGITDLIFEDAQGDILVVELKRDVLQREHIAQVIDYLADVENRYQGKTVELMIVANIIPAQRRTKLERLGVSFLEIPEAKFLKVAEEHGVSLSQSPAEYDGGRRSREPIGDRIAVDGKCQRTEVASLVQELIDYGERFVSGLGKNLKGDLENSDYQWLSRKVYAQLSRWCNPHRNSGREQWVRPRAHEISEHLFGEVIPRSDHPSYSR